MLLPCLLEKVPPFRAARVLQHYRGSVSVLLPLPSQSPVPSPGLESSSIEVGREKVSREKVFCSLTLPPKRCLFWGVWQ